jgi:hypothetical protein
MRFGFGICTNLTNRFGFGNKYISFSSRKFMIQHNQIQTRIQTIDTKFKQKSKPLTPNSNKNPNQIQIYVKIQTMR